MQARNFTPRYLPEENQNNNWKRYMYPMFTTCSIYNSQDMKAN